MFRCVTCPVPGVGDMVTPYLSGNVAGPCSECAGVGSYLTPTSRTGREKCPTCRGYGVIGKSAEDLIAEAVAEKTRKLED